VRLLYGRVAFGYGDLKSTGVYGSFAKKIDFENLSNQNKVAARPIQKYTVRPKSASATTLHSRITVNKNHVVNSKKHTHRKKVRPKSAYTFKSIINNQTEHDSNTLRTMRPASALNFRQRNVSGHHSIGRTVSRPSTAIPSYPGVAYFS